MLKHTSLVLVCSPSSTLVTYGDWTMMLSLIQGLDLYIKVSIKSSQYFLFRFSADLDRMKRGAMEALRKHRDDTQAGAKQLTEDPQLYWHRMRPTCATRLADVAADLLTVPAVPSERLFSVAGVMCAGEQSCKAFTKRLFISCFKHVFFFIRKEAHDL